MYSAIFNFLSGKKTHLIGAFIQIAAIVGFVPTAGIAGFFPVILDFVTSPEMITLLQGAGLNALRAGVSKQ